MKRLLIAVLVSLFALPAFAQQKQRVVFQVSDNDPAKWNLALNNARNVQQDLGKDNVQIEIVAYGPGLNMLKAESKEEVVRLTKRFLEVAGQGTCEIYALYEMPAGA